MIRAVFFDLDDTLCNSARAFRAGRDAAFDRLRARHANLSVADIELAWSAVHAPLFAALEAGLMTMEAIQRRRFADLLRQLGVPDDAFAEALDLTLGQAQLEHLRLFPDAAVLDPLRQRMHIGIITNGAGNAHPDSQRSKAAHLGLLDRMDSFWISDEMGHRKPDPRAFQPALDAAGLTPGECLFVGDSPANDIGGANSAGLYSVLISRGEGAASHSAGDVQPSHIVRTLFALPDLIEEINGRR